MADLFIRGGTIVDGSGTPGYRGDVVIDGDRFRILRPTAPPGAVHERMGAVEGPPAARTIDATGKVVAPGFIDLHSHSGLTILADPRHEPKVRQGVTTEVIGVDGLSYAPMPSSADLHALVQMNAGLDGRPDLAYDWDTVASYLGRFDRRVSVNIGLLIGNSALRLCTTGWEDRPLERRDLERMRGYLREAMAEGALGVSSGLDYPPGAYAGTDELATLSGEAARAGGFYHTHVRYALGDRYLDPFREAIEIGRRGEAPVHITHFYHRQTFPGGPGPMLALVDEARADGRDVTFDTYPYEWASTRLLIMLPLWVQSGGPGPLRERLADPAVRDRLRREIGERAVDYAGRRTWDDVRLGYFARPENLRWEGCTLGEVIAETGAEPVDAVCDLLLAEDLRLNQVTPGPWSATLPEFVRHPVGMVGTDSTFIGDLPSPRTYGSFPRILGQFVRDEQLLSLEEAVHKMTSAPARRLGLRDRGRLADGARADVVVFDPATVRSLATYEDPRRFPVGIEHVIVNGELVVDDGEHTDALPGRVVRR